MADIPIICGTLDYCRDPMTGDLSKWAHKILDRLKPSHMEVNDSGTGFRLWCRGTLPGGTDHVTAFGPQMSAGDMPDCAYLNIIHAASDDDEKDKLVGSEPVWNCLDLAVTTEGPQGVALEDRTDELCSIVESFETPVHDCDYPETEGQTTWEGVPAYTKDCSYGVTPDGSLFKSVYVNGKLMPCWVCDGFARISEQMRKENGDAVFVIEGRGAKDGHTFEFRINAEDFAEGRKLKAKLAAQFGASNRVGGLNGDIIQQISHDIKKFKLIETPCWIDGKAAVPGLDLIPNLRYVNITRVPAKVGQGNLEEAQQSLDDLLPSWDPRLTTVVYTAIIGSPIVARWYPGDRFGIALKGTTGMGKTEFAKNALATFGEGYLNEDNLMRWGDGATQNALMKVAAYSGLLAFLLDNYKALAKEHPAKLVGLLHAILEGSDKARLTSDSELMDSNKFACTPIITGEDFPFESSTFARCPVLEWSPIRDSDRLSSAQRSAHNLPALGKEWLTWLSLNSDVVENILGDFERYRSDLHKELTASGAINPGRLASTFTLLRLIWIIALKCPALGKVLEKYTSDFEAGIDNLMKESAAGTTAANEAEDFVNTLNELIGNGGAKLANEGTHRADYNLVGWVRPEQGEVCIFPKTARRLVSALSQNAQALTSVTLNKQLHDRGYIKTEKNKEGTIERTLTRKFNGKPCRVLVFINGIQLKE